MVWDEQEAKCAQANTLASSPIGYKASEELRRHARLLHKDGTELEKLASELEYLSPESNRIFVNIIKLVLK